MAEPKRIQLTTIAPVEKDKKTKLPPKTIRINLTLKDSTDTTCPEFSYTELTKNELGEISQDGSSTNPFGDDDDANKMAAIAKAFEEKYAPKPKKAKKGGYKDHLEDLIDLGEGYDEDDPFIDNAEAYDEVVPVCMTTSLGGFYINSGQLDFKYQSEESIDEFQSETPIKKKKVKRITSDTDSEAGEKKKIIKKRKFKEGSEGGLKKKKRLLNADGKKINRNKLAMKFKKKTSPTVAQLLKDQRVSTSPVEATTNGDTPVTEGRSGDPSTNPSVTSAVDSMFEQSMKEDSSQDPEENEKSNVPDIIPPLPTNIPESLGNTVKNIKEAAKKSSEGKCKFFTSEVNNMLLSIEVGARQLTCGQRSSIYGHLAAFLPCSKETLLKRAKKLRLNEVDDKLREPINKLREAINKVMPSLLEMHEAECQLAMLARQEGKEKNEGESKEKEDGSTESDEEDKVSSVDTSITDGEKVKKRIMGPRKRFVWDEETRKCLLAVVRAKMQCYDMLKTRMQSPEEYLRNFLDTEIKPLWPQGWIQTRMLYKESKAVHAPWTNPKQKKSVTTSKQVNNPASVVNSVMNKVLSVSYDGDKTSNNSKVIEIANDSSPKSVPTLLDYAEKTAPTSNKQSTTISPTSNSQQSAIRNPPIPQAAYTDISKVKDSAKHHLVSEILQKPLAVSTNSPMPTSVLSSSAKSPNIITNPNPKESNFFLEFQKHLSKQLSPNSQEKHGLPVSPSQQPSAQVRTQYKPAQMKPSESPPVKSNQKDMYKVSEALQKQYQAHMNKAQQVRQAATQQKQVDQQLLAELQFQKAYMASVQSSTKSPSQPMKQFSPKTTVTAQSQSAHSGRDQILAQIQAELARGDSKLKFKQQEAKTSQKIIEDAVMQQMFKQPLPANTATPQRPLLQQALRTSPVSSTNASPTSNSSHSPHSSTQHSLSLQAHSSLLSPTSPRNITVDLTTDSPPKTKTSPVSIHSVKRTSPSNQHAGHLSGGQVVHRPGYVVTSSTKDNSSVGDRSLLGKVFMQPQSTQQSHVRQTSLLNSSNKNMQAQWNAAFGVNSNKIMSSSPLNSPVSVSKTLSSSSSSKKPDTTFGSPAGLSYSDVCEILGVETPPPAHQPSASTPQTSLFSHSSPTPYNNPTLNADTSKKPHGQ